MNVLQAHAAAFLDLLDADDTSPALVVHNGTVSKTQVAGEPYVLVYFRLRTPWSTEVPEKVSLEQVSDVIDADAYCHSVGANPVACLAVAGRVRAALLGKTPDVAGRLCYPIGHEDSQPANRDESTGTAVFDLV